MTRHSGHFDEFQPHTLLKHAILDAYLVAWAMKLLIWGGAGDRLVIIDAFAGVGHDAAGNDGSPLIAIKRARQAMQGAKGLKAHLTNPKIHVFAIEKSPSRFRSLKSTLEPFLTDLPELVRVMQGDLADHLAQIRSEVGDVPTFYFLDPFGIKGLDYRTHQLALSAPHSEIFALFADIGAVRLHGLVTAQRVDSADKIERIVSAPSLFPEHDVAEIVAVEEASTRANESLDASIPASRAHLTRALGGEEWVEELNRTPASARPDAFLRLFNESLLRAGASYVLTVPIRNDEGHRVYALVHACKSLAGFVTMKESVSHGLRHSAMSDQAREAIMQDLSIDLEKLVESLRHQLAGERVPWAADRTGLRDLLLGHTPLFQFQMPELKSMLKSKGILRRIDRKEICDFPLREASGATDHDTIGHESDP